MKRIKVKGLIVGLVMVTIGSVFISCSSNEKVNANNEGKKIEADADEKKGELSSAKKEKGEKYLPNGSIVLLNEGTKEIMIYGRKQLHEETKEAFDYVACLFPEGNIGPEYTFLFNHEDIKEVIFKGYEGEQEVEYNKKLQELDKK